MFRFRLQKVLDLRTRLVDQQAVRLQESIMAMQKLRAEGDALQARIDQLVCDCDRCRRAGQPIQIWRMQTAFLAAQQNRLATIRRRENRALRDVDREREALIAAQRRKEVLERLAARQRQQWSQEQMRRERKELDEIGAIRAALSDQA